TAAGELLCCSRRCCRRLRERAPSHAAEPVRELAPQRNTIRAARRRIRRSRRLRSRLRPRSDVRLRCGASRLELLHRRPERNLRPCLAYLFLWLGPRPPLLKPPQADPTPIQLRDENAS